VEYRGITLEEFDLDATLARKPEIVLVDELAHTNAPESRHPKRWQDVKELLDSGISVYTTMNVQHIETLNDVVAQITGIIVQETVPDAFFEYVDEIEVIDLPPDELLERLKEGKVYIPQQAALALEAFFKKPNLTALRELSLRKTAEVINPRVQSARIGTGSKSTWPTTERLLVCIGPSPTSQKVIRTAKRLSVALGAEWIVAHVETPQAQKISSESRRRLDNHLHLAEELGAEIITLGGLNRADEIVKYANQRNVTKIIVGKTPRSHWYRSLHGSVADEIQIKSSGIDVYIIPGEAKQSPGAPLLSRIQTTFTIRNYWKSLPIVALSTIIAYAGHLAGLGEANKTMIFLAGVAFVAVRYGRGPGILASVLSVLLFDFMMIEPYFSFSVTDKQYLITFAVMLGIAVLISTLASRVSQQATMLRHRMRRTDAIYRLTKQLSSAVGQLQIATRAEQELTEMLQAEVILLISHGENDLSPLLPHPSFFKDQSEQGVAIWAFKNNKIAGQGSDTLPHSKAIYLPLIGATQAIGILAIKQENPTTLSLDQVHLFETFASQIALALEREILSDQAKKTLATIEAEQLRNALLSSVSHDFRTPLASIIGEASRLRESQSILNELDASQSLNVIIEQATRLNRYIANLLEITRIESGSVKPDKQWNVLEDVVGSAIRSLGANFNENRLKIDIPTDLPPIMIDSLLIEHVLVNLIENAVMYSPPESTIELVARSNDSEWKVEILDRGQGIPAGEEERLFEKFYHKNIGYNPKGAGLGLSICDAIIRLHEGSIRAENRPDGGARFVFTIPIDKS
jgi:two-component system sensor histidine kinase KdpD